MDYKKIECDNYNIHLINNKKYHNVLFTIYFTENIEEEKLAYHNLLVNILTRPIITTETKAIIKTYSTNAWPLLFFNTLPPLLWL